MAKKLLALALNPGAGEGEWRTAATKFISKLRDAGIKPEEVHIGITDTPNSIFDEIRRHQRAYAYQSAPPPKPKAAPKKEWKGTYHTDDMVMPFGKHKGKMVSELPTQYLLWLKNWLVTIAGFELLKEYVEKEIEKRAQEDRQAD